MMCSEHYYLETHCYQSRECLLSFDSRNWLKGYSLVCRTFFEKQKNFLSLWLDQEMTHRSEDKLLILEPLFLEADAHY